MPGIARRTVPADRRGRWLGALIPAVQAVSPGSDTRINGDDEHAHQHGTDHPSDHATIICPRHADRRAHCPAADSELGPATVLSYSRFVSGDRSEALIRDMRESFERLEQMVADLHPTDETDPAKAEVIAGLKRELESLRGGLEELERRVDD